MGKVIGIDLGTTNSVCAFMEGENAKVIINEEGSRITPSVVGFSKTGDRFVGDVAKRQMLINPEATIHSIKRFMGRKYRDVLDDLALVNYEVCEADNGDAVVSIGAQTYRPQEISAAVLQKLKKSAEDFVGEPVTEAVITVPAYFTDSQRQATRDAGTIAGLQVLRIINEPTAAALCYVKDRQTNSTIAVYDFGGGTFDISIVQVDQDIAEVRATRGNNALGGADIDRVIVDWLLQRFEEEHGKDISDDRIAMQRLHDAAERAKLELSAAPSTDVHLPFLIADETGPKHLQANLDRGTFEALAEPLFQQTLDECKLAMADAGIRPNDVDDVILVGGSSRIPRVQSLVQEFFRRRLNKSFNPDEVVAIGAAIQGGILEGDVKAVTLLDVTNFSLGIETEGKRFAPLIPKNTPIPTQKVQMVSTVIDNQDTVKIHVLQGESDYAPDNVSLGEFELADIPPATRGVPRIRVRFALDANGIVNVSATDTRSGKAEAITINAPASLTAAELQALADEAAERSAGMNMTNEVRQLRGKVENYIATLEDYLERYQGRLERKDVTEVEHAVKRGRMVLLKDPDKGNLKQTATYLSRFEAHIAEKIGPQR